ncbi:hypothetical protein BKA70DRAFT_840784 [Coprinopsis sp. MPI-PUGE-AT-0042]|nr:hypothetical protein BKA70DRAFT_840784 [Coprinopsis sp. MPI-PUGE-AT-0042]
MASSEEPDATSPSVTISLASQFEPDREWKEKERRRIRRRLQNIVSEAKLSYELRRGKEPDREPVFKAEYDKAIQQLGEVAMDDYQEAIRKERQRRKAEAMCAAQQRIPPVSSRECIMNLCPSLSNKRLSTKQHAIAPERAFEEAQIHVQTPRRTSLIH